MNWLVYKDLVRSLATGGWNGPPIVVLLRDNYDPPDVPLAVTGSHRLAAAEQAGVGVPCVDLAALFQQRNLDLNDLLDEWIPDGVVYSDAVLWRAIARVLDRLPAWVIAHYGINLAFCPGTAPAGDGHQHLCNLAPEHYVEDDGWHECAVCAAVYAAVYW